MKENELEQTLIEILTARDNQWTYRPDIKTEDAMWENLRHHVNRINIAKLDGVLLTDKELVSLKTAYRLATETAFKSAQWLRGENGRCSLAIDREDVSKGRITLELFSNNDIAGGISSYEVVNQIQPEGEVNMRSDVTLLINGLPIIHIELKAESAKDGYMQAYEQTKRYTQAGFFTGIFGSTQIFVVSNKVATKYFARPVDTSDRAFEKMKNFLFNWRTPDNEPVENLFDFARVVLSIPTAHELVSKFSILVDDKKSQKYLMVLRPYQIHAINKIRESAKKHEGGFIWHATGSGKTITSFVATKLLSSQVGVYRTVMVLDRTDLDNQTKNEFSKFASEYNTGSSSADVADNSLIIGIKNQKQLTQALINKKNSNTILVSTIQKISAAIRSAKEQDEKEGTNKLEKLKGEHIVFIVDECHRAVSDEQMREIKKFFPKSTWFGLTGTPIFEENQKQENGTFARTTAQQYGVNGKENEALLHAYTTKNAVEDESVLNFQVEYFSLLEQEEIDRITLQNLRLKNPEAGEQELSRLEEIDKEQYLDNTLFENDLYIETMLKKIFRRASLTEKYRVINGYPTMSAILTTHSIAQAKRIYHKLMELKEKGDLITGREKDERHKLTDSDFPRVAITYSISDNQSEMLESRNEMDKIINDYNQMFDTKYSVEDIDKYNLNINNRLARKDIQYQTGGNWLDLVIVVDRLLTGFDSPTIQTLFVDRELKYQKLLQAFSRTNRKEPTKEIGMVVALRKPYTMKEHVKATMRLFSNEDQNWEALSPKEFAEVQEEFNLNFEEYQLATNDLTNDPQNLEKKIKLVKSFQAFAKVAKAIKSYDDFNEDDNFDYLSPQIKLVEGDIGKIENLIAEIKEEIATTDNEADLLNEIEFSASLSAIKETIGSFYINNLLKDLEKAGNKEKLQDEIKDKPADIQKIYARVLNEYGVTSLDALHLKNRFIKEEIERIVDEESHRYAISQQALENTFNEYNPERDHVPHLSDIVDSMQISKEDYEFTTGKKFRSKRKDMESIIREIIEEKLLPLKGEL